MTPSVDGHGDAEREADEKRGDRHVPQRLFGAASAAAQPEVAQGAFTMRAARVHDV